MLVALAMLAVLPYLNGLTGDFTYDDKVIIRDNPRLSSPSAATEVFTTHYFGGSMAGGTAYRPVVLLTYAVQRWLHGNRPVLFHLVNVALHAGTTLLLAQWLVLLGFPPGACAAVGALFAVVTIHVEAVTSLVGRAEVLAALLVLLAAILWRLATEGQRLSAPAYAGCLAAFTTAVFVKENAVVVPGVVALGELFRGGGAASAADLRARLRRHGWAFLGLFAPVAVLFTVRKLVLKGFLMSKDSGISDLENPLVLLKAPLRVANAAWLLFRYVAKAFVPTGLSADHSAHALRLASRLAEPQASVPLLGLALAAALTLALWRAKPLAAFGSALFFGTLLPTSNLLFPIGTIFAERLMYLPAAGLLAIAVGLLTPQRLEVPRPSPLAWRETLLIAAVLAYGAATVARNRVWRDDRALYSDMLVKVPRSAKAHYNFAYDAQRRNQPKVAREHLERAVALFPRHYDSWALLGKISWDDKRLSDAVDQYRRAVKILPHYENGRFGLARTLQESGKLDEAEAAFRAGIAEFPDSYPLAYHHALLLEQRGRLPEAEREWKRTVRVSKETALAHLGHARVLARLGRRDEAWDAARRALVANRTFVEARLFLSEEYERAGKTLGAVMELTRAYRTQPADPELAARALELGLTHPEARTRASTVLPEVERRFGRRPGDERLRRTLESYRAGG